MSAQTKSKVSPISPFKEYTYPSRVIEELEYSSQGYTKHAVEALYRWQVARGIQVYSACKLDAMTTHELIEAARTLMGEAQVLGRK